MLKMAILGHGVVGSGVALILEKNIDFIEKSIGEKIELKKILDLLDFKDLSYSDKFTKNFDDILNDDEIFIVVESIGGLNPSYDYVKKLLNKKKHVVTSNKELVSEKGAELLRIAYENKVEFLFEASVGGGMPILRPLKTCFSSNKIKSVVGILNGTTNFILHKMSEDKISLDEALKIAQSLGYAEKDSYDDIHGVDAARKAAIIASLVLKKHVLPCNIYKEGINEIKLCDILFSQTIGYVIKLIASINFNDNDDGVSIMVCPMLVSNKHNLSFVCDVLNAVVVNGNFVGEIFFMGAGAGKTPTASAVLEDVIEIAKLKNVDKDNKIHISDIWSETTEEILMNYKEIKNRFYFRFEIKDEQKAKDFIFKNYNSPVFLECKDQATSEIAFVTDYMLEGKVEDLEKDLKDYDLKQKIKLRILDN